jgi:cysteinyl-tRNA synthetase (EC 6.1.1.16)
MNIKLYNTLTRKIEDFIPIDTNCVKIYTCGPTVYHYAHLGNLRAYVFADILQRTLKTKYKNIKHVINITDVGHLVGDGDDGQDKMEKGAARENKNVWEIANFYTEAFLSDIEKLNINKNNFIWTKATDYIKEQIELVKTLTEKGYTYTISDGIYFDTSKFNKYGELAKLDIKNLNAGKRINLGEKKHKTDFALWKFSPKNEKRQMEWIYDGKRAGILITDEIINTLTESENKTRGFPGWHIECSAMSISVLGKHFDIHTGGIDHIPVHHTNEIAQSECAYDTEKFVNYWCHVNFLNDKTGKMSKSNNDFLRLETLIEKGYNPLAYRYMLLGTSYKTEINFSYEALTGAQNALSKLQNG